MEGDDGPVATTATNQNEEVDSGGTAEETRPLLVHIDSFRNAVADALAGGEELGSPKQKHSEWKTIALLVSSCIGSGVLNQPYVMSQAGIAASLVLYIISPLLVWCGFYLLVEAAEEIGVFEYDELARAVLGDGGAFFSNLMIVVSPPYVCRG